MGQNWVRWGQTPQTRLPQVIKKKDIVESVAQTTSLKKYQAREGLEAALGYIHEQLEGGEEVQIPPLGKIRIVTQNEGTPREKIVYRLVLTKPKREADPEAETIDSSEADIVDMEPIALAKAAGS